MKNGNLIKNKKNYFKQQLDRLDHDISYTVKRCENSLKRINDSREEMERNPRQPSRYVNNLTFRTKQPLPKIHIQRERFEEKLKGVFVTEDLPSF